MNLGDILAKLDQPLSQQERDFLRSEGNRLQALANPFSAHDAIFNEIRAKTGIFENPPANAGYFTGSVTANSTVDGEVVFTTAFCPSGFFYLDSTGKIRMPVAFSYRLVLSWIYVTCTYTASTVVATLETSPFSGGGDNLVQITDSVSGSGPFPDTMEWMRIAPVTLTNTIGGIDYIKARVYQDSGSSQTTTVSVAMALIG